MPISKDRVTPSGPGGRGVGLGGGEKLREGARDAAPDASTPLPDVPIHHLFVVGLGSVN